MIFIFWVPWDEEVIAITKEVEALGVPMILAADSAQVAAHAAGLGLLTAEDVTAVQHAIETEVANPLEKFLDK